MKPDPALNDYWRDNDRFADLFNQVFCGGKEVILPRDLTSKSTDRSTVFKEKESVGTISRYGDIAKQYSDGTTFVLMTIENQMLPHYAMPVRSFLYDALGYDRQCKQLARQYHRDKDLKGSAEYLSGMTKNDKINQIVSLVVYYGEQEWDGPTALSDMMEGTSVFRPFVNDYRLNLLDVRHAGSLGFKNKDNKDFFELTKYWYDHKDTAESKESKAYLMSREVDWDVAAAIGVAIGSKDFVVYSQSNKGGKVNMCKALENVRDNGFKEGVEVGEERGEARGEVKGTIKTCRDFNVPDADIVQRLQNEYGLSHEVAQKYLESL